jgi:hydroxyethylthiazole kinase-like sugar kinase family protein
MSCLALPTDQKALAPIHGGGDSVRRVMAKVAELKATQKTTASCRCLACVNSAIEIVSRPGSERDEMQPVVVR